MGIRFGETDLADIRAEVSHHLAAMPSAIDSYLEDHILASSHYRILDDDRIAGYASIHQQSLVTQFVLCDEHMHIGQLAFQEMRRSEQVRSALVATGDEFYLSHALDSNRQLSKQAYFFATGSNSAGRGETVDADTDLVLASQSDIGTVRDEAGDFFDPVEKHVDAGSLFLVLRTGAVVGFGLIESSVLQPGVASIGMFTISRFRGAGVGTATIRHLIAACRRRNLRPVAGCWYYNDASKRTLERAGMYSPTRLLRIEY